MKQKNPATGKNLKKKLTKTKKLPTTGKNFKKLRKMTKNPHTNCEKYNKKTEEIAKSKKNRQ